MQPLAVDIRGKREYTKLYRLQTSAKTRSGNDRRTVKTWEKRGEAALDREWEIRRKNGRNFSS